MSEQLSLFENPQIPSAPARKEQSESPRQKIDRLRYEIETHDQAYWAEQKPRISDGQYDALKAELQELERAHPDPMSPNSPTQKVGLAVPERAGRIRHGSPMLSLDNAFDAEQMQAWWSTIRRAMPTGDLTTVAEWKLDGLAIQLTYRERSLAQATTRGDGTEGEDVTHNAKAIANVPLRLGDGAPDFLEVRGEVYMPLTALEKLNEEERARRRETYANARNAAAGTMRQNDPGETARRGLRLGVYGVGATPIPGADTYSETLAMLRSWGLPVPQERRACRSVQEMKEYYDHLATERPGLDHDVDGMVVKVDDLRAQEVIGTGTRAPKWAIAWKFPSEEAVTVLESIEISSGRFGKLTPVANLKPIPIRGVTVRRASLHNEDYVLRNDIRAGDNVLVQRAGDVIPQVMRPVGEDPARERPKFRMPEACPHCQGLISHDEEAAHRCDNDECPARLPEQLRHFASREIMDIEGLGDYLCGELARRGLVKNVADIYSLSANQIAAIPRMGPKSAAKLMDAIEVSKSRGVKRVLNGLQIYRLGNDIAGMLSEQCSSVAEASELTVSELVRLDGIGEVRAQAVVDGFALPRVQKTISLLEHAGVTMDRSSRENGAGPADSASPEMDVQQALAGYKVLVTGTVEGMNRTQVQTEIRAMGGETAKSLSSDVNLVIYGEKPGSNLQKARSKGLGVMDHMEFLKIARMARSQNSTG